MEPNGDTISRKLVYAFLSGLISDDVERKKALDYINELPPVEETVTEFADRCRECGAKYGKLLKQESKYHEDWTECSPDNLPDMDVDVMGTTKYGDVVKVTRMKTYREYAGWEWILTDDVEGNYYHPDEIIAWMSLPKPYKKESEDKK